MTRPRLTWTPSLGRYLAAIVEQGLWSLLNLGANLGVARLVSPEDYGSFVFWTNLGFVLASLQNALTLCHLFVLAPGKGTDEHRLGVERLMHVVTLIFLAVVGACSLGADLLWSGPFDLLAGSVFLPAYLLQQYMRSIYFSRGEAFIAMVQTGLVLALAVLFLGLAIAFQPILQANLILLCLTAAYGIVGVVGAVLACWPQMKGMGLPDLRRYAGYAAQSGWVFLGVSTTELLARFYAFIVAAWYGPRELAILAATQILMRPLPLLAASWTMVARVDLVKRRDAGQWGRFTGLTIAALVGGAVIALAWTTLITVSWPLLAHYLFSGKYSEYAWMAALWGVSAAINFAQIILSTGLQVLKAFKVLALANAAASLTAALAIVLIMSRFGYAGAIAGTAAGQLLEAVVMALLLAATLRSARAAANL